MDAYKNQDNRENNLFSIPKYIDIDELDCLISDISKIKKLLEQVTARSNIYYYQINVLIDGKLIKIYTEYFTQEKLLMLIEDLNRKYSLKYPQNNLKIEINQIYDKNLNPVMLKNIK